jgi:tRNA G46 methylase TrmB
VSKRISLSSELHINLTKRKRLTLQHRLLRYTIGGLYPAEVKDAVENLLEPKSENTQPAVLDVGSGSGVWFVQSTTACLAKEFEHPLFAAGLLKWP